MSATATPTASDLTIRSLNDRLAGDVRLPGDPAFAELATPWNVALAAHRPARAVVAAADATDVCTTVRFAAAHGLRIAVQCTGHGAAAFAGEDVIVLHTGRLDEITIDPATRTARIGAGLVWQQVIDAAAPYGLAPLCGSSPTVGVVGMLTGGGIGPLVRTYGLSGDYVRAFELVTGDGALLRVTAEEHADLFWALRGGKASVGIVTAVELELIDLPAFHGGTLFFDGADAPAVLHAWRAASAELPEATSTSVALLRLPPLPHVPAPLAGRLTVAVRIASVDGPDGAEAFAAPLLAVASPVLGGLGEMPYAAIGALHADPVDPMPVQEGGGVLAEISAEMIDALLAGAGPETDCPLTIVEVRLLGGALAREPRVRSAFGHRDAVANLTTIGVLAPPVADAVRAGTAAVEHALDRFLTGAVMPNFAGADPDRQARSYDEETRHWLGALAEQYDPAGVLAVGQVVRGAA